ncbi:MAG: ribonuclease E/G [Promethearchaeota archaeon]
MKYNVFIRGIYSTALTKLFLDTDFNIIFPSKIMAKRFPQLKEFSGNYSKDIVINDRYDRQGISVTMKKEIWEDIKDKFPLNRSKFPYLMELRAKFPLNQICKGIVIQSNRQKGYSLVRLMPDRSDTSQEEDLESEFTTTFGRINKILKVGTEDVFQVVFEDVGKNYAYLNQGYTVSGNLAVIMPYTKKAFISKKIKDKEQRQKLRNVINKISTEEFGILLRTAAQYASEIEILREIQQLRDKSIKIEALINQSKTKIGPILTEYVSINYLFPQSVKVAFDEIRSQISATMPLHHSIKSGSYQTNNIPLRVLNLVEKILDQINYKGLNPAINEDFIKFYNFNLFTPKQFLNIYHYKINGRKITLKPGIIKKISRTNNNQNQLKIILRRNLSPKGYYDGLNIPIEEGDYAIGIYTSNSWYYETIYYSQENELKGKYFNINTPIFFDANGIHYFDLEIDVIEPLNQPRQIIDQELLEKALELNIISKATYDKAIQIAEDIKSGKIKSELELRSKIKDEKTEKEVEEEEFEKDLAEEIDEETESDDDNEFEEL